MLPVQSSLQKYLDSLLTQITSTSLAIPAHTQGAFRDRHERRAWDAMDAVAPRTNGAFRGRRSRVVLTPRRRRQVGERNFTDDGDKKARSPGRARNRLLKPSRAGMPGDPGATVVTNARAFYTTRAAAGATGTRHSPRPPWAKGSAQLGRLAPRDREGLSCRHCERSEAIHSSFAAIWIASLRSQ
jgi:hypothetical protein